MATDTRVNNTAIANDADFRASIAGFRAQLAAAGLVQAADTGQINPATATKPTVNNTAAGYEIWRFDDALQATLPVFIKVEYGTGPGLTTLGWWLTVGTGSNGAGTLTGQVSTRRQTYPGVTGVATWYASGSMGAEGGRFAQFAQYNAGNNAWGIFTVIERTRDANGNPTADGIIFFCLNNGTSTATAWVQHVPANGTIPAGVSATNSMQLPTIGGGPAYAPGKSLVGLNVALVPTMAVLGKLLFGTTLFFSSTDIGDLSVISVNQFGAAHNFLCFSGSGASFSNTFANIVFGIAMRWE